MGANGGSTRVPGAKKIIFSKNVPRPLGMLKQVFLGRFEPVVARFAPWKIPKCLEHGPFWDQQWVKNGSKPRFSKSVPGPFGMLKQVFLARFEPVLTEFSPFHHMYAPLCALRTYLRAVWWSHLELGEGCRLEDIYIYIYIYIFTDSLKHEPYKKFLRQKKKIPTAKISAPVHRNLVLEACMVATYAMWQTVLWRLLRHLMTCQEPGGCML